MRNRNILNFYQSAAQLFQCALCLLCLCRGIGALQCRKPAADLNKRQAIFRQNRKICNCASNTQIEPFTVLRILSAILRTAMDIVDTLQTKLTADLLQKADALL